MINETIKEIYIVGKDDRHPDTYPVVQTDKQFYQLYLDRFDVIANPNLTGYRAFNLASYRGYEHADVHGATIKKVYANQELIYLVLSDGRTINLGMTEKGEYELVVEEHDEVLRAWFDSSEPREGNLQVLTSEQPRWQQPNISLP